MAFIRDTTGYLIRNSILWTAASSCSTIRRSRRDTRPSGAESLAAIEFKPYEQKTMTAPFSPHPPRII
jgi:hypothetical protein